MELLCPVRIAPFFVLGVTKTELVWNNMEIFYRDPDGTSTSHSVTASLIEIQQNPALGTVLGSVSSNSVATTTDTRWDESLSEWGNAIKDAQHLVRVVLKQGSNNGTDRVRLTAVRLFIDPPESPEP